MDIEAMAERSIAALRSRNKAIIGKKSSINLSVPLNRLHESPWPRIDSRCESEMRFPTDYHLSDPEKAGAAVTAYRHALTCRSFQILTFDAVYRIGRRGHQHNCYMKSERWTLTTDKFLSRGLTFRSHENAASVGFAGKSFIVIKLLLLVGRANIGGTINL